MKKLLSYIWPQTTKVNSDFNGILELTLLNGKRMLDSKNTNYSYGDLASFDTKRSSWTVEPGTYIIKIGASSQSIKLKQNFKVTREIIAEKDNKASSPKREIKEFIPVK